MLCLLNSTSVARKLGKRVRESKLDMLEDRIYLPCCASMEPMVHSCCSHSCYSVVVEEFYQTLWRDADAVKQRRKLLKAGMQSGGKSTQA